MEIGVLRRFLVSASERAFSPIAFCERALGVLRASARRCHLVHPTHEQANGVLTSRGNEL
jgi:hypothetical protein